MQQLTLPLSKRIYFTIQKKTKDALTQRLAKLYHSKTRISCIDNKFKSIKCCLLIPQGNTEFQRKYSTMQDNRGPKKSYPVTQGNKSPEKGKYSKPLMDDKRQHDKRASSPRQSTTRKEFKGKQHISKDNEQFRKKKRFFDSYTISIWAENMAKRGGSANAAVQMILNRIESGKARPEPALYNTALDILGHKGMLKEAAKLLQEMIAKNVPPNDKTICSLLNAIAEHAKTLPKLGNTNPINPTFDESKNEENSLMPELGQFQPKDQNEAMRLAIKLYQSWTSYSGKVSCYPFNCLLKVLAVTGQKDLLKTIFPLNQNHQLLSIIPEHFNVISYTIAIRACDDDFVLARKYWEVAMREDKIQIDASLVRAIFQVLRNEMTSDKRQLLTFTDINERKIFIQSIFNHLITVEPVVELSNTFLTVCLKFAMYEMGVEYWNKVLRPILSTKKRFKNANNVLDETSIILVMRLLQKQSLSVESLDLLTELRSKFHLKMTTDLFSLSVTACRKLGNFEMLDKLVKNHLVIEEQDKTNVAARDELVELDVKAAREILLAFKDSVRIKEKKEEEKVSYTSIERQKRLQKFQDFCKSRYPDLYREMQEGKACSTKNSIKVKAAH